MSTDSLYGWEVQVGFIALNLVGIPLDPFQKPDIHSSTGQVPAGSGEPYRTPVVQVSPQSIVAAAHCAAQRIALSAIHCVCNVIFKILLCEG